MQLALCGGGYKYIYICTPSIRILAAGISDPLCVEGDLSVFCGVVSTAVGGVEDTLLTSVVEVASTGKA